MRVGTHETAFTSKKYKPYKSKYLKCYGMLLDNGQFDTQYFVRGAHAFVLPIKSDFIEDRPKGKKDKKDNFINVRELADWCSMATFKNARHGRTEENISHARGNFLDLDGPYTSELPDGEKVELPLTDDIIRQRCNVLELPTPMIIESSPNRYHLKFYYLAPESISRKWKIKAVQKALHEAFKDLGSDELVAMNLASFLRNEDQKDAVNKKYRRENKPRVVVRDKGEFCTLDQLYRILKRHGYIKQTEWPSHFSPDYTSIDESRSKLIAFLKANQGYISTYKDLADKLGMAMRTLKRIVSDLRQEGKLTTRVAGRWQKRRTQFTTEFVKVHIKESFNSCTDECTSSDAVNSGNSADSGEFTGEIYSDRRPKETSFAFSKALELARTGGLPVGVRNLGVFILALWLKTVKDKVDVEIVAELDCVFTLSCESSSVFSRKEFLKCISSACRKKYVCCIKAGHYKSQVLFNALGLGGVH